MDKGIFTQMADLCDESDAYALHVQMARVEAATYTDEDGKEWIDGSKLFGKRSVDPQRTA